MSKNEWIESHLERIINEETTRIRKELEEARNIVKQRDTEVQRLNNIIRRGTRENEELKENVESTEEQLRQAKVLERHLRVLEKRQEQENYVL